MKSLSSLKKHIGGFFLFIFLFSADTFLYGTHSVEELGHDDHSTTNFSGNSDSSISLAKVVASHQHEGDQGAHHEDGASSSDNHSHASIIYPHVTWGHSPRPVEHRIAEPFRFIPEVYLDKFIPPQNLA